MDYLTVEQEATNMICERLASEIVWSSNMEVKLTYWKALKGVCYELNVNPKDYIFAARKERLNRHTKRQGEGKNKPRRPSSLMKKAKMLANGNSEYITQLYRESQDYRERLVRGY